MNWKIGEKIFLTGDIFQVNPELTLVGIFNDPNTSETLFFSRTYLREMLGARSAQQDLVGSFQVQVDSVDCRAARDQDDRRHVRELAASDQDRIRAGIRSAVHLVPGQRQSCI